MTKRVESVIMRVGHAKVIKIQYAKMVAAFADTMVSISLEDPVFQVYSLAFIMRRRLNNFESLKPHIVKTGVTRGIHYFFYFS